MASEEFFGIQNARKARTGFLAALQDPQIVDAKREAEAGLRAWVDADAERRARWGGAWDEIRAACEAHRAFFARHQVLDARAGARSELFSIARRLVRLGRDRQVLLVTHLPTVASHAARHLRVEKRQVRGRTIARIAELNHEERIGELARMLAGEVDSGIARKHAAALIEASRSSEENG